MPVLSRGEATAWVDRQRRRGDRIVFTNGVFDLLHPGHVRYLARARQLGDALVVGVNSDRSVRVLAKGGGRPVIPEAERAEVLAALSAVDAVVVFDEETPFDLVKALEPDVLVKGADWAPGTIVGAEFVEQRGGQVLRVPVEEGYSTSRLIETIRATARSKG
ncbi:MAG: D-glycero-beta-D-manno-heptose 1-phosphate adenylyltransferase [Acidobacteriota bacterium]